MAEPGSGPDRAPPSLPLVSSGWLAAHLHDPRLRVVDVRWTLLCVEGREVCFDDPDAYRAGHIPGAVFVGMQTELSDPDQAVPDMLAPPDRFAREMERLGIGDDTLVVCCDDMGVPLAAARLWWALNRYGHDRVRVLDGGLRQWRALGYPLSTEIPLPAPARFTPRPRDRWVASWRDVEAALAGPGTLLLDCLPPERYRGDPAEPRSGHIPGARNVPYLANIDPSLAGLTTAELEDLLSSGRPLTFAPPETLADLYRRAGVTPEREVIAYCGRGYAGACGLLALRCLGHGPMRLYDGSWLEWSADPRLPLETGEPPGSGGRGSGGLP
jgi:thiosulfate/3-mercaptopyruvate sulfurtransferase